MYHACINSLLIFISQNEELITFQTSYHTTPIPIKNMPKNHKRKIKIDLFRGVSAKSPIFEKNENLFHNFAPHIFSNIELWSVLSHYIKTDSDWYMGVQRYQFAQEFLKIPTMRCGNNVKGVEGLEVARGDVDYPPNTKFQLSLDEEEYPP